MMEDYLRIGNKKMKTKKKNAKKRKRRRGGEKGEFTKNGLSEARSPSCVLKNSKYLNLITIKNYYE